MYYDSMNRVIIQSLLKQSSFNEKSYADRIIEILLFFFWTFSF